MEIWKSKIVAWRGAPYSRVYAEGAAFEAFWTFFPDSGAWKLRNEDLERGKQTPPHDLRYSVTSVL